MDGGEEKVRGATHQSCFLLAFDKPTGYIIPCTRQQTEQTHTTNLYDNIILPDGTFSVQFIYCYRQQITPPINPRQIIPDRKHKRIYTIHTVPIALQHCSSGLGEREKTRKKQRIDGGKRRVICGRTLTMHHGTWTSTNNRIHND
jgi:hypothetical protein